MAKNKFKKILLATLLLIPGGCVTFESSFHNPETPEIDFCFNKALKIKADEEDPEDYWQTPKETDLKEEGDCEDIAGYLQDCLYRMNKNNEKKILTRIVCGYTTLKDKKIGEGHAWLEYKKNGKTYILDAALQKPIHQKKQFEYIPFKNGCNLNKILDYMKRSKTPAELYFYNLSTVRLPGDY